MKRVLLFVLIICVLMPSMAFAAESAELKYAQAKELLQTESWQQAATAFDGLGSYEDSAKYAMYCRARAAAQNGQYADAIQNLSGLEDFRDSRLLITYYTALGCEATQNYEEAGALLSDISMYADAQNRLNGYPEKINARDYAIADRYEQNGALEDALAAFKALGSYSDSASRAEAVQQKIYARDYAAAEALENQNKLEDALAAFKALGSYSDSVSRAEAVQQKIYARDYASAEALETRGAADEAYDIFVSLGSYSDSASRADALYSRAMYMKANAAIAEGEYASAKTLYTRAGEYEDSDTKLIILNGMQYADFEWLSETLATYRFHDMYGVINFAENTQTDPIFTKVSLFSDNLLQASYDGSVYGIFNPDGTQVSASCWDARGTFRSGVCIIHSENGLGLLESDGKLISKPQWKAIGSCEWSTYASCVYWGDPVFDEYGLICVENFNELCGLMDKEGNLIVEPIYDYIGSFTRDRAQVCQNLKYGLIDHTGAKIAEPVYSSIGAFCQDRALVCRYEKYGFINSDGEQVIDTEYTDARVFSEDVAAVQKNGKWGYINLDGSTFLDFIYDDACSFRSDGTAEVCLNGIWQIIDRTGKKLYFCEDPRSKREKYNLAVEYFDAGEYAKAARLFAGAEDYADAAERLAEARELAGMELVNTGLVAGGLYQSIAVCADGTVRMAGKSNAIVQNVAGWNDVVKIYMYGNSICALTSGGTVLYAGDKNYDTESWTDITDIGLGTYHLIGLRSDGTVRADGKDGAGQCDVADWQGITDIAVYANTTAGLTEDGTVRITGGNSDTIRDALQWTDIAAIALGAGHLVGLRSDGTVVAAGSNANGQCDVSDWSNIVAVATGAYHTIGLRADGTVVVTGSNGYGACDVEDWQDIVSIATSYYGTIGLCADGTVVYAGDNTYGQQAIDGVNINDPQPMSTPVPTPKPTAAPTIVYYNNGGKYYHKYSSCKGMDNAPSHTLQEAKASGKKPCKTCNPPT